MIYEKLLTPEEILEKALEQIQRQQDVIADRIDNLNRNIQEEEIQLCKLLVKEGDLVQAIGTLKRGG